MRDREQRLGDDFLSNFGFKPQGALFLLPDVWHSLPSFRSEFCGNEGRRD